jgi:hypothetical protein
MGFGIKVKQQLQNTSRRKLMKTFELLWPDLIRHLKLGLAVKNWTVLRGYLGDEMTVVGIDDEHIEIRAPKAKTIQRVPKTDFEKVWEVWSDYKSQKLPRFEIRDMTPYSKYIISMLRWYEQNVSDT